MATLTNINPKQQEEDKEIKPLSGQSSSMISPTSQVQGPASSGVQSGTPASGRFTNIQKYLGANKQAGSQLGQAIDKNVGQQVNKATGAAQKSQQDFQSGLGQGQQAVGQLQDYTTKLGQKQDTPATPNANGVLSNVTGPAYLASGYEANLGNRANYAQELAGNQDELNKFLTYRSGQVAADQQQALQQQNETAEQKTNTAQNLFGEKQQQLASSNQRGGLLSDIAKNRSYGMGQQSLDNAFLQLDKNNTISNLKKNLQQQEGKFKTDSLLPKLTEQFGGLKTSLADATKGLQTQTEQNLTDLGADVASRQQAMIDARNARGGDLQKEFEALQSGGRVSKEFADSLGLQSNQRLYNTLADIPGVGSIMDMTGLQSMPTSQSDLANQKDIDLYSTFARLAQTNPALTQASTLGAEKADKETLNNRIKEAEANSLGEMTSRIVAATGSRYNDPRALAGMYLGSQANNRQELIDYLRSQGLNPQQAGGSISGMGDSLLGQMGYYNLVNAPDKVELK